MCSFTVLEPVDCEEVAGEKQRTPPREIFA
jgi:hypothetical protein